MSRTSAHQRREPSQQDLELLSAFFRRGRHFEVERLARSMTQRYPRFGNGWSALGAALQRLGRAAEALPALEKAAELMPRVAEPHFNLGVVLHEHGRLKDAEARFREALRIESGYPNAHANLGDVVRKQGRLPEAAGLYEEALRYAPESAAAFASLGRALLDLGRFREAEDCCRRFLQVRPASVEAWSDLGTSLSELGRGADAEACIRRAIELGPEDGWAHYSLGKMLVAQHRFLEAEASLRRAMELHPEIATVHDSLGYVLEMLLRLDEAEASFRRAVQLDPSYPRYHSNLLLLLSFAPGCSPQDYLGEAREFGKRYSTLSRFTDWRCVNAPERLRVGIVSGSLWSHPVGYFLEGVLPHLDPSRVELHAYANSFVEDGLTQRIKSRFSAWTTILEWTDESVARRVHDDGVHVLIDLDGHTARNRLPAFAWKPAPVQVSWLGYFASTGVEEIDYLLADPWIVPHANEALYSETIWRLPRTRMCYSPPADAPAVSPLPALGAEGITFGCFNGLLKITPEVRALWARLLQALPASRLFLKNSNLDDPSVRERVRREFAALGIGPGRLYLEGFSPRPEYLAAHSRVDIALDPFPYNGGTVTADALWMGVPVLTLAGDRLIERQGVALLANVGLDDWIALDPEDFVARAKKHASDLEGLAAIRGGLRERVSASPIFDAPRFARDLEDALWDMWRAHVPERGPRFVRMQ